MKILSLCGNYNSLKDGIGRYGKLLNDELKKNEEIYEIFVATGYTDNKTNKQLKYSLEMSKAIIEAVRIIKNEKINVLLIEYPFMEHNPIIIFLFIYLKIICKKRRINIVLSLHEYLRAKKLRQILIKILAVLSNKIIVSDVATKKKLFLYNKNIFIRDIPCNIEVCGEISKNITKEFVYFGLVNNSKAFFPMIEAWKEFNKEKIYKLNIITSSSTETNRWSEFGIYPFKNLNEKEIAMHMEKANFCILPILPSVSYNNSTFKTACMFGCISIGKFDNDFKKLNFIVDLNNYNKEEFVRSFEQSISFNDNELEDFFFKSRDFGKDFTLKNTANHTLEIIKQ